MKHPELNAWVSVISCKRPMNVPRMEALLGVPVTWIVAKGDAKFYRTAGAQSVIEGGGLCESRNHALREAWALGLPCVQLSDDLKKMEHATLDGEKKKAQPISFTEALRIQLERFQEYPYSLGGVAPTANLFYFNKTVQTNLFVVGDWIVVKPCDLFFDEAMKLKEDYDYTLKHLEKFGGVIRSNDILATFEHRTNHGGAVSVRTSKLEQEMIDYLRKKWPDSIRDNPRRKDEILMRWGNKKDGKEESKSRVTTEA